MIKVAFRDDDLDVPNPQFLTYHQLMQEYGFPVTYAVIPGRVSEEDALFFRRLKQHAMMNFTQHGWMHTNHGGKRKAEFGVRPRDIERHEISMGFKRMNKLFGNDFLPLFVPPYHAYTMDTCKDALDAGCAGWSAKDNMPVIAGMKALNAHILFDSYSDGGHSFLPAKDVIRQFLLYSKRVSTVIFLTHHKKIGEDEQKEFITVLQFLAVLRKKGLVTLTSFSELMCL